MEQYTTRAVLRGEHISYNDANRIESLYRPFILKNYFAEVMMNDRLTRNHYEMFGTDLKQPNKVICFRGLGNTKPFGVLATGRLVEHQMLTNMQCLPLYRYTEDGERVSNITDWGLWGGSTTTTAKSSGSVSRRSWGVSALRRRMCLLIPTLYFTIQCTGTTTRLTCCGSFRVCRCITIGMCG